MQNANLNVLQLICKRKFVAFEALHLKKQAIKISS